MTERSEEFPADRRGETPPAAGPPDPAPPRRVTARRLAVLSGAVAVAVLAVIALLAVVRHDRTPAPTTAPATTRVTVPVAQTTERVAAALGINDPEHPEPGAITFLDHDVRLGTTQDLLGGRYEITMVCVGGGSVDVTVDATDATVVCDTATPAELTVPLTVADPGATVPIVIDPHVAGAGQAVFGYHAELSLPDRTRYQDAALAMLPESGRSAQSMFLNHTGASADESLEPGRYRIRAACVGYGAATLSVGTASPEGTTTRVTTRTVRCGRSISVAYRLTGKGLFTSLEPDADAAGRSGGAITVEEI